MKLRANLLAAGLGIFAGMAITRSAVAQNQFFPTDATINYNINGNAFVGYASQSDFDNSINPTSPTVSLVTGGRVSNDLASFNSSTINLVGGSGAEVDAEDTSTINISGGTVGEFDADGSSTINFTGGMLYNAAFVYDTAIVNVSGGRFVSIPLTTRGTGTGNVTGGMIGGVLAESSSKVVISGGVFTAILDLPGVEFFDQTKGKFTFIGAGLMSTPVGTDATVGGMDYALSGILQNGQSLAGDVINVQPNASMFTFTDASVVPKPGTWALCGLGAAALFHSLIRRQQPGSRDLKGATVLR